MQFYWDFRKIFGICNDPSDIHCLGNTIGGPPCTQLIPITQWMEADKILNEMDGCHTFPSAETLASLSCALICDGVQNTYEKGHSPFEVRELCLRWLQLGRRSGLAVDGDFDVKLFVPVVMAWRKRAYRHKQLAASKPQKVKEPSIESSSAEQNLSSQTKAPRPESAPSGEVPVPLQIRDINRVVKSDERPTAPLVSSVDASNAASFDTIGSPKSCGLRPLSNSHFETTVTAKSSLPDWENTIFESGSKWQRIPLLHLLQQLSEENKKLADKSLERGPSNGLEIMLNSDVKWQRVLLLHLLEQLPKEDKSLDEKFRTNDTTTSLSVAAGSQKPKIDIHTTEGHRTPEVALFPSSSLVTEKSAAESWLTVLSFRGESAPDIASRARRTFDTQLGTLSLSSVHTSPSTEANSTINPGSSTLSKSTTISLLPESTAATKRADQDNRPQPMVVSSNSQDRPIALGKLQASQRQFNALDIESLDPDRRSKSTEKTKEATKTSPFALQNASVFTTQHATDLKAAVGGKPDEHRPFAITGQLPLSLFDTRTHGFQFPEATVPTIVTKQPCSTSAEKVSPPTELRKLDQVVPITDLSKPLPQCSISYMSEYPADQSHDAHDKSDPCASITTVDEEQQEEVGSSKNASKEQLNLVIPDNPLNYLSPTESSKESTVCETEISPATAPEKDNLSVPPQTRTEALEAAVVPTHLTKNPTTITDKKELSLVQPEEEVTALPSDLLKQPKEAFRTESQSPLSKPAELEALADASPRALSTVASTDEAMTAFHDIEMTVGAPRPETPTNQAPITPLTTPLNTCSVSNQPSAIGIPMSISENCFLSTPYTEKPSSQSSISPVQPFDAISPHISYIVRPETSQPGNLLTPPSSPEKQKQRHTRDVSSSSVLSGASQMSTATVDASNNRPPSSSSAISISRTAIVRKPVPTLGATERKCLEASRKENIEEIATPELVVALADRDNLANKPSASLSKTGPATTPQTLCVSCGYEKLFESWGCECDGVLEQDEMQEESIRSETVNDRDEKPGMVGGRRRLDGKVLVSRLRRQVGRKVVALGKRVSGDV